MKPQDNRYAWRKILESYRNISMVGFFARHKLSPKKRQAVLILRDLLFNVESKNSWQLSNCEFECKSCPYLLSESACRNSQIRVIRHAVRLAYIRAYDMATQED